MFHRVTRLLTPSPLATRLNAALAAALALVAMIANSAVAAPPDATPARFKLLTWNIQLLPTFPSVPPLQKKQALRTPWIVEFLNDQDYDVIVLEEVADHKCTSLLKDGLKTKYPYIVSTEAKLGFAACGGGILFASKLPLKYVDHIVYKNISGIDGLAEKGCVLVEGQLDGMRFQVAGTHLQAGDDETRAKEVPEIFTGIIKPHRTEGVPQLLAGDMNIDVREDLFRTLLSTTEMQNFPLDDPHPYTTDGQNSWNPAGKRPKHIDHVLLNPRGTHTRIVRQTIQRPRRQHEGETIDLADHYGVVAEVELKP